MSKTNKSNLKIILLSSVISLMSTSIGQAQQIIVKLPLNSTMSCNAVIDSVKADLESRGYFTPWTYNQGIKGLRPYSITPKIQFDRNGVRQYYYNHPTGRENTVIITTSGNPKYLDNFLHSPKLMTTISAKIIAACTDVGLVKFTHYWEGAVYIGYFSDNTVRTFNTGHYPSIQNDYSLHTIEGKGTEWGYYFGP